MKRFDKAKKVYESIDIPNHLQYMVNQTILDSNKKKFNKYNKLLRYSFSTVACSFVCFVCLLNLNPSFATNVIDIPIIGSIAKIFTIKEIFEDDETKFIDAKIPAIENTGNTELEKRINYEINYKINEILDEVRERAKDYKNAIINNGGKEEQFYPIDVEIDYKIGYSSNKIVSFAISKSETLATAYTEWYFYNIDIETGRKLNLRDVLGKDYKQIIDKVIYEEIKLRSQNPDNIYFVPGDGGFTGIENEYQDFYINKDGKVVIVFEKYQIAPGYMGTQEFVIDKEIV